MRRSTFLVGTTAGKTRIYNFNSYTAPWLVSGATAILITGFARQTVEAGATPGRAPPRPLAPLLMTSLAALFALLLYISIESA